MKFGIHAYAWCSKWSNETLDLIDRTKELGLDFIELPLMVLEEFDTKSIDSRLKKNELHAVTSTVLFSETDITSTDKTIRQKGTEYLKDCVRATAEIGADSFSGVIYSQHVKAISERPTIDHWEHSAEALHAVAEYAEQFNINIGIEPVNRYETYLINTCEQAKRLKEMIGKDNIKIHLDTYHMNVEEKSFYDATKLAGKDLIHYHLCECDRGIPGTGHVDWEGIFKALSEINYKGYAAMESFVDITDNINTWVWRQLAPDGDTLVKEGIKFIRSLCEKYNLTD